jgi:hypothetical protein
MEYAQQRDATTHVLQAAVVASPIEFFADLPRQTGAVHKRDGKQIADQFDLGLSKVASALAHL